MEVFFADNPFYYIPFHPIQAVGFWGYIRQFLHHPNQIRGLLRAPPLPSRKVNEITLPVYITRLNIFCTFSELKIADLDKTGVKVMRTRGDIFKEGSSLSFQAKKGRFLIERR